MLIPYLLEMLKNRFNEIKLPNKSEVWKSYLTQTIPDYLAIKQRKQIRVYSLIDFIAASTTLPKNSGASISVTLEKTSASKAKEISPASYKK